MSSRPYRNHLRSGDDLVTTYEATRAGFVALALEKHWKTARAALDRIREAFSKAKHSPHTFFVGAAIERKMAGEIWDQLERGLLTNAANLNDPNQIASVSRWLCTL